jgi:hypothetical protein
MYIILRILIFTYLRHPLVPMWSCVVNVFAMAFVAQVVDSFGHSTPPPSLALRPDVVRARHFLLSIQPPSSEPQEEKLLSPSLPTPSAPVSTSTDDYLLPLSAVSSIIDSESSEQLPTTEDDTTVAPPVVSARTTSNKALTTVGFVSSGDRRHSSSTLADRPDVVRAKEYLLGLRSSSSSSPPSSKKKTFFDVISAQYGGLKKENKATYENSNTAVMPKAASPILPDVQAVSAPPVQATPRKQKEKETPLVETTEVALASAAAAAAAWTSAAASFTVAPTAAVFDEEKTVQALLAAVEGTDRGVSASSEVQRVSGRGGE